MSGTDEKNEQPYAQERTGGVIYLGATHEKLCKLDEHASSTSTRQGPMRLPRGHTGLVSPSQGTAAQPRFRRSTAPAALLDTIHPFLQRNLLMDSFLNILGSARLVVYLLIDPVLGAVLRPTDFCGTSVKLSQTCSLHLRLRPPRG